MSTPVSRRRLEFATAGFMAEMRKQFVQMKPDEECPIKFLADYSPEHRSALMAGIYKAIVLAGPGTDASFNTWLARQAEEKEKAE